MHEHHRTVFIELVINIYFCSFIANAIQSRKSRKKEYRETSFSKLNFDGTKTTFRSNGYCHKIVSFPIAYCSVAHFFSRSQKALLKKTGNALRMPWCIWFFFCCKNWKCAVARWNCTIFRCVQKFEIHRGEFGYWNIHWVGDAWIC